MTASKDYASLLNDKQLEAVYHTEGPLLILAGAGSGKTRVLTHRIAYLIEEKGIAPYHILAITFTNKAAAEMRERAVSIAGEEAKFCWISTFHSACIRILKAHAEKIGYSRSFTIFDPEDQKALMRRILKENNLSDKMYAPKAVLAEISHAKDELIGPSSYADQTKGDYYKEKIAFLYDQYQKALFENQAMDFDDIIGLTVRLFETSPEVLSLYQERFRYIMVDEYQDTNTAQYRLVSLLASRYRNLCVVGDDDQSIYRFRGANIRNILDFEKDFPDACVIRLEQNYRSTSKILHAANHVIRNNVSRKEKTLWTKNGEGQNILIKETYNDSEEARIIASQIQALRSEGAYQYKDMAILYRTNAQSRALEEKLVVGAIPYRLYGGTPFYQRREIKDLLCYLRLIASDRDYVSAERIMNVPPRGIGDTTFEKFLAEGRASGLGVEELCRQAETIPALSRASKKLEAFGHLLIKLRDKASQIPEGASIEDLIRYLMEETGYLLYLAKDDPLKMEDRMENIEELISRADQYEEGADEVSLGSFLDEIALVSAIDDYEEGANAVSLMTLHSAKGLEFPVVFISGMEDGLFPGYGAMTSGEEEDMEEERRLLYVGITRAKEQLYLTYAKSRRIHGMSQLQTPSTFLKELPAEGVVTETLGYSMEERTYRDPYAQPARKPSSFGRRSASKSAYDWTMDGADAFTYENPYLEKVRDMMEDMPDRETSSHSEDAGMLQVGDAVKHKKFGLGTVLEVKSVNADYQVKVNFARVGEKLLFAKLAGLKKV